MSITKAFRKLPPEDRKEAKLIMEDLMNTDGVSRKDAAREAISMMLTESMDSRDELIKKMSKSGGEK